MAFGSAPAPLTGAKPAANCNRNRRQAALLDPAIDAGLRDVLGTLGPKGGIMRRSALNGANSHGKDWPDGQLARSSARPTLQAGDTRVEGTKG
jgi:hypothetical protein